MKLKIELHRIMSGIAMVLLFGNAIAQNDLDDYLQKYPTEPRMTSFDTYGSFSPPSSYGVIPISIPLMTLSTRDLQIPVYLSYDSGAGIPVNQRSSEIGLGWSLNINNFYIEATINDDPDWFAHNAQTQYNDIETRKNSNDINEISGLYFQIKNTIMGEDITAADFGLDEYRYNFNGHSGNFLFDELGEIINLSTSNSDLTIIKDTNGFTVWDSRGYTYSFTKVIDYEDPNENKLFRRRWLLEKIKHPNQEEVIFTYTNGSSETGSVIVLSETNSTTRQLHHIEEIINPPGATGLRPPAMEYPPNSSIISHEMSYVKSIEFANGKLEIDYALNSMGKLMLSKLNLFGKSAANYIKVKAVQLNNVNYYVGQDSGSSTLVNRAPKLEEVAFLDENDLEVNKYQLFYNPGEIPSRSSAKKDYWGYYAGPNAGTIPDFTYYHDNQSFSLGNGSREPIFSYTQNGILNKIVYPTGGYTEFSYEPNYYYIETTTTGSSIVQKDIDLTAIGANPDSGGNWVATPEASTTFNLSYGQVSSPGGITVTYSGSRYTPESPQAALPYIRVTTPSDGLFNNVYSNVFHIPTERESGTFHITNIKTGEYKATAYVGNSTLDPNDPQPHIFGTAAVELSLSWSEYVDNGGVTEEKLMTGGGLRIKEIKSYDGNSTTPSRIQKFNYGSKTVENQEVGSFLGVHTQQNIVNPINGLQDEDHMIAHFLTLKEYDLKHGSSTEFGGCIFSETYGSKSLQISSEPQFPIQFNGSSVHYDKVIISSVDSSNQAFGKTEYFYSSPKPKKIYNLNGNWDDQSSSAEKDIASYSPYAKVHLKEEIHFNDNNDTIQSKKYNYITTNLKPLHRLKLALSDRNTNISGCYISTAAVERAFINDNLRYYTYYEPLEIDKLFSVEEKNYLGNTTLSTSTNNWYTSNNSFRVAKTSSTNSKEEVVITKMYYPDDISFDTDLGEPYLTPTEKAAIDKLKTDDLHRLSETVQTETYKDLNKDGVADPTELLGLSRTYFKEWHPNIVSAESVHTLKTAYSGNNQLQKRIQFHSYDTHANILDISKSGEAHIYTVWGYNHEYPIARIENLQEGQITTAIQHRIDAAIVASDEDDDRTLDSTDGQGNKVYVGKEGELREALSELRNDPALAETQITTYTYDPTIGVTSITDPRGYTIYYEYDSFNRLKEVKDANGNLVTDYKYNYRSQN
ncbi:RHS repeat domain-containing protein [Flagellimonas algicola]|uniref:YD repeat-containing protein n=1 Tax=Flagellimonas algicola TaxID=2583815 RepID=A0ABY2WLD3_9FLAO|nr:RHS repeat domain-containing protein [Allomuricauda algicola]TMU55659.1 hypothetical protein FGG15_15960 [Allomuricauda algicola]